MGYGYNIYDANGNILADEGDEVVFSSSVDAMLDALNYLQDYIEGNDEIPDTDITISIMERSGEGFYK